MGIHTEGAEIVDTGAEQTRQAEAAASQSRQAAERAAADSAEWARQAAERSASDAFAFADRSRREAHEAAERERSRYNEELFRMTATAANNFSTEPHPSFPGATAGQIHSDPQTILQPRGYAAEQNASYMAANPTAIPQYGVDSPVVNYQTNVPTDNLSRAFSDRPVGPWATLSSDIGFGNISGSQVQGILDLSHTPTNVSDVHLPLGTTVERSRPVSEHASQFRFSGAIASWFSNIRKLG